MPKRLAITISGAVSLGSYEAGVLYEIIHALRQHNSDPATSDAEKVHIDVLAGASAGGMTATIAAQKLLYEASALESPYDNAFYLPWVADVSMDGLLSFHGDDDASKSIFSSQHIKDISQRYLTQRYRSQPARIREKHPACAETLRLGLALANLNGVDYGVNLLPQGRFIYTCHQDRLCACFEAANPTDDTFELWETLRNAAVSCGAFPFAFRTVDVTRSRGDYDLKNLITPITANQIFTYTDGGTFQNEPLGIAKNLVDLVDEHLDVENRFYLFVSPDSKGSTASADFCAQKANFRETALQLAKAVFGQARFQDWIMAEKINAQVALLNARATQLQALLANDSGTACQTLRASADLLLPTLFPGHTATTASSGNHHESIDDARTRLRQQYAQEYQTLPTGVRETWIDVLLTLETAAGLGNRDEMNIYGITASADELASSDLVAFAGFFDRRYREHDYDVGRRKTQEFLANPGALGPLRFTPEPIRPIDSSLNGLKLENMDRDVRLLVRDRICDRAKEIMKEAGIRLFLARQAIAIALIRPELSKLLKL